MRKTDADTVESMSLPMRGEWIEIARENAKKASASRSLPVWGEWIEICVINGAFG